MLSLDPFYFNSLKLSKDAITLKGEKRYYCWFDLVILIPSECQLSFTIHVDEYALMGITEKQKKIAKI